MLRLGDIEFKLLGGPLGLSGEEPVEYAEQKVIEGKPRLQWVGDGLQTISLPARFHAEFCDPAARLEELRRAKDEHKAWPLLYDTGRLIGMFVITRLGRREEQSDQGRIISLTVDIDLKECVPDPEAAQNAKGPGQAIRRSGTSAVAVRGGSR